MFDFLKKMKITSFLIIMLIASFIPIVYTIVAVSASEHYAGIINIAGRQRMLNQRFLKEILLAKSGTKTEPEKTLKLFLKSLGFLHDGGTLSIGDGEISMDKPGEEIKKVLDQVKTMMTEFVQIKDKAINGSNEDFIASLGTLFELNKKIHKKSNDAVVLFQKESESANSRTILFELILGVLGGIIAILVILSIKNRIEKLNSAIGVVANEIADGNISTKIASDVGVDFTTVVDSIGNMTKAYTKPLFVMSSYFKKFASGEISDKITDEYKNDLNEVKININSLVDTLGIMLNETSNIISFVKKGDLDHRTDPSKFKGKWKELLLGINEIVDSIAVPFDLALNFISDVSVGKKLKRIDGDFQGKYKIMVNNINDLADILTIILSELSLLTKEIDGNGIISKRIGLEKVKGRGSWEDVLLGVNNIVDALVLPINTLSGVLKNLGNGIIPSKITREKQGDLLEIKNAANDTIDNFSDLQKAGAYLKKLSVNDFSENFEVNYKGIFADLKDSINEVKNSFLSIQDITTNIANGNLSDMESLKSVGSKSKNDKLIPSFIYMMESINNLIVEAKLISDSAENGELDFRADENKHKGKYKEIINGANRIKDNLVAPLKRVMKFINNTAKGKVDPKWDIDVKGDYKLLYENVNILKDGLINILEEIRLATKAAADGNLSNRIDISKVNGDWKNLLSGINTIIDNLLEPVNEAVSVIKKMAAGDLSKRMVGDYKGDDALLKDSLNIALDNLVNILRVVDVSIEQVNGGADQVSDASQSLSQGATEQAASLEEVSSSMQEIGSQSKHNAENAAVASKLSIDARKNADDGNAKMDELDRAMKGINESSNKIKKVIKVIDDIAFQTNLLAINAAVEAARAGVHGKGFAVVASEVRNLAQKSAKAAEETTELIEGSIKEIEVGNELSDKTAEFLSTIVEGITKVTDIVEEISAASDEQNRSISQSIDAIEQVSIVTQQNAAASEETASASVELTGQSNELKKMIAKFKLGDEDNSAFDTQNMVLERREEPKVVKEEVPALEYANDEFGEF